MKKFLALGVATILSACTLKGENFSNGGANQQNWDIASTFLRFEPTFETASPERVALFYKEDLREKHRAAHNGDVQVVVFGGMNSNQSNAAAYYMPGGLSQLMFNASVNDLNGGTNTLVSYWSGMQQQDYGVPAAVNATFNVSGGLYNIGYATAGGTSPNITGTKLTKYVSGNTAVGDLGYARTAAAVNTATVTPITVSATATAVANDFVVGNGTGNYSTFDLDTLTGLINSSGTIGDFQLDTNKNIGIMRPWNFGVGYAPNVQFGNGVSESQFVSVITPELRRSHWDIGIDWKQILSTKDTGFWLELSTVLQGVSMELDLQEAVSTEFGFNANPDSNADNVGYTEWIASWLNDAETYTGPQSITEAFAQDAWNYGKLDGKQSVTRLADIELKLGYQFICEENVMSTWFIGMVIPTGNKAQSTYLAEPIVGNGFHFGLMTGGTQEIQWNASEKTRWTMRTDTNFRYLFKNQQIRSFDTLSNGQWSRYMMVWPNYETEQLAEAAQTVDAIRAYSPGINYFTQEVNVTPRAQARINQAVVLEHGGFQAEFGWNMLVRQAEQVSLVTPWVDNQIAFVDASNTNYSLYNETRTIYNDAYQSSPIQNLTAGGSQDFYNFAAIQSTDLNLDSAASPAAFTNTPYLAVGYAFNEERSSVFSLGASYEISATNGYINDWTLWGKFSFSF